MAGIGTLCKFKLLFSLIFFNRVNQMSLALWCQALDPQTRRPVQIKSAKFRYGNQRIEAKLSGDKLNASLVREKTPAVESGIWKCDINTAHGNASGKINVYGKSYIC